MGYYERQIAADKARRKQPTAAQKAKKHTSRPGQTNGHVSQMRHAGYTARIVRG